MIFRATAWGTAEATSLPISSHRSSSRPYATEMTHRRMLPLLASLPRSSASRRTPWDRGGRVRGRSPLVVAAAWLGHCPSTPCMDHRSRGIHTDLQGPTGGSDRHSFENRSFHPPDRCAPSFLTRSDSRRPTLARRTASHGVVKVRPSVVHDQGVHSATLARHRAHAAGPGLPHPTTFRPRGFSPPRRFPPPRSLRGVAPDADPGVRHVSACCETGFLATHSCPSELCSPMAAAMRDRGLEPRAIVTEDPTLPSYLRSPVALPPRRCVVITLARSAGRDRGALLHHRSCGESSRCRSDPPDALLGLSLADADLRRARCRHRPRPVARAHREGSVRQRPLRERLSVRTVKIGRAHV